MKLLITDTCHLTAEERAYLEGLGLEVIEAPDEAPYDGDPAEIDAIACKFLFSYAPIERFVNLKYVQLFMAGWDHVPMDYIRSHGIEFHNARGVYSIPIAEFGIAGVLALYKKLRLFDSRQRARIWEREPILPELTGRHVLVVGAGSIGGEFAKRFRAFDCRITGLTRHVAPKEYFDDVRSLDDLDDVLPDADIVIMCLPGNEDTRHIIDGRRFAMMKPDAIFVNVARGVLADEAALVAALENGRLGGAVLDVFETEPLPEDNPLWAFENVIVLPHTSFGAQYNVRRSFEVMNRDLAGSALLKG